MTDETYDKAPLIVVGSTPNIEQILDGITAILNADATSETKTKALEAVAKLGSIDHAEIKNVTITGDTHNHYHAVDEQPKNIRSPWYDKLAEPAGS